MNRREFLTMVAAAPMLRILALEQTNEVWYVWHAPPGAVVDTIYCGEDLDAGQWVTIKDGKAYAYPMTFGEPSSSR